MVLNCGVSEMGHLLQTALNSYLSERVQYVQAEQTTLLPVVFLRDLCWVLDYLTCMLIYCIYPHL